MTLAHLCEDICYHSSFQLKQTDPISSRLMCPEYSKFSTETKTYPYPYQEPVFALCWILNADNKLFATLKPSKTDFSYCTTFPNTQKTQLHTHDYLELAYIVSGEFSQKILGKTITFHQGELCFIDKNCAHQDCFLPTSATILFFGISNSVFHDIMTSHVAEEKITKFLNSALLKQKDLQQYLHFKPHKDASNLLEETLKTLLLELIHHDEASPHICKGLLMRIFRILSIDYDFSLSKELKKEMNWLLFEEITSYIKEHYQNITIQQLTKQFHFQEDYFNRLIKSKVGVTYTEYVQDLRLKMAEQLLLETNLSIDEISEEIGYQNKGYFYKLFMERYHITPAQFRKKELHS